MIKLNNNIIAKTLPDLTFFIVRGEWNDKFKSNFMTWDMNKPKSRIFCTLEGSLSMRSVNPFLYKNGQLYSIDFWNSGCDNSIAWEMGGPGICFAETGKIYRNNDFEELKRDYYIAKLSGIKQ